MFRNFFWPRLPTTAFSVLYLSFLFHLARKNYLEHECSRYKNTDNKKRILVQLSVYFGISLQKDFASLCHRSQEICIFDIDICCFRSASVHSSKASIVCRSEWVRKLVRSYSNYSLHGLKIVPIFRVHQICTINWIQYSKELQLLFYFKGGGRKG